MTADELPEGWTLATLSDLISPSSEKVEPEDRSDAPYLSLEHIEAHSNQIIGQGTGADVKSTKAVFRVGDVLYGKLRPYLNKVAIPDFEGICSTDILVFRRVPHLDNRFLLRFLSRQEVVEFANHHSSGVQLPRISFKELGTLEVPLPPLAEQRRIVAAVERILGKVSAARARLERVPTTLKRFRQAVLAAACSGRLTADWRAKNLGARAAFFDLARLEEERRSLFQGKKTIPKGTPPKPDLAVQLPEGWEWATVSQLARLDVGFAFKSSEYTDSGIPLLRGENVEPGALRWKEVRYWPTDRIADLQHLLIESGEIILALDRPIISTGLKIARAKTEDLPCLLVQRMMRFKMVDPTITEYLFLCLQTPNFIDSLQDSTTGSDLPHITGQGVAEYSFPFPPLAEQQEIVRRVSALFALADAILARASAALKRVEALAQAVLAKAFRGELVPTEAELARRENRPYESAGELLERIRASTMALAKPSRTRKPK